MFEDDIFEEWLDSESRKVLEKFKNNEDLSVEDKMVLTLKAQTNHFYHLDKEIRHEIALLKEDSDKRFERVDKRFEQIDRRFEQIDKRFEQVDKRFEQVDRRFEQVNKRFEQIDKRFEQMNEEIKNIYLAINNQTWKMIGSIGLIVIIGKLIDSF